jgi:AAA+ superfamily predicted ATPase
MDEWDNLQENLSNIEDMLRAMVGDDVPIDLEMGTLRFKPDADFLSRTLGSHLYDAQWVYRLASLMVGNRTPPREKYDAHALLEGIRCMNARDKHWEHIYPAVRPPYFSPLLIPPKNGSSSSSSSGEPASSNLTGAAASKDYNSDEKRLLSGLINAKDIRTTFNEIIVPPETKESLINLTTLSLIRPEAFTYGVLKTERIPGCLLYGPPGTGKTLLAKAVAKESGASMLEVSAASINDKWLGQSEKNVQALFSLARKLAPCVIFLDEADALLAARHSAGPGGGGGGRAAHRETITQFLREWDGLTSDLRAFIMVATNRPFDLDEAVLRRLPRRILVDLPLAPEREAILRVVLRDEVLADDVSLARLAEETDLYSGSDLKNLCVSAAMEAVREEMRAKEAHAAADEGGEFRFPPRRVLARRHFDKGLRDITASISGDMESLKAIRRFDEQYGDAGRRRRARRGIGFDVVPGKAEGTEEARVRQVGAA